MVRRLPSLDVKQQKNKADGPCLPGWLVVVNSLSGTGQAWRHHSVSPPSQWGMGRDRTGDSACKSFSLFLLCSGAFN